MDLRADFTAAQIAYDAHVLAQNTRMAAVPATPAHMGDVPVENRTSAIMGYIGDKLTAAQCEQTCKDILGEAGVNADSWHDVAALREVGHLCELWFRTAGELGLAKSKVRLLRKQTTSGKFVFLNVAKTSAELNRDAWHTRL